MSYSSQRGPEHALRRRQPHRAYYAICRTTPSVVPDAVDTVPLLLRYGADVNARSAERGTCTTSPPPAAAHPPR